MKNRILTFIATGLLSTLSLGAQSRILPVLENNNDVRTAAMGNTLLGNAKQMYLYSNPAALAYADKTFSVDLSGEFYPQVDAGRLSHYALSLGYKLGRSSTLLGGVRYQGGLELNTQNGAVKPKDWTIDLGYAFRLTNEIMFYASGSYIKSEVGVSTSAWAFSVGAAYQKGIDVAGMNSLLTVGARFMDFGKAVKYNDAWLPYSLPTSLIVGGDWSLNLSDKHQMTYALSGRYFTPKNAEAILVGTGLEYTYARVVSARVGYECGDTPDRLTMGLGCRYKGFKLDVAYAYTKELHGVNTLQLGLGYTF